MPGEMTITPEVGEALGFLDRLSKQFPYAVAIALNRTAEDGLASIRDSAAKHFTIRTPGLLTQLAPKVLPSAYRATTAKLRVVLEPEGAGKLFRPFETGLPHKDRLGRPVAIPSTGPLGLRPYDKAVIPRFLYPVNLGLVPKVSPSGKLQYNVRGGTKGATPKRAGSVLFGKRGTFMIQKPGNRGVIYQRMGPGKGNTRPLWYLQSSVPRPANLHFYATAQSVVNERWAINMRGAWDMVTVK